MTSDKDPLAFARLMPGFDFMRQFTQAAAGKAAAPNLAGWVAPTLDVQDLDKRIADLKAVQFWLEQNLQILRATVQALEVQKMTLAALQGMNLNMADVAKAFAVPGSPAKDSATGEPAAKSDASAATAKDAAKPAPATAQPKAAASAGIDPLQWWGALTQQFQTIAANTLRATPPAPAAKPAGKRADKGAAPRKSAAPKSASAVARKGSA